MLMGKFSDKLKYYLDIRTLFRSDKNKNNLNLKFMNGMNRISIMMFLFAIIVMTIRYFKR